MQNCTLLIKKGMDMLSFREESTWPLYLSYGSGTSGGFLVLWIWFGWTLLWKWQLRRKWGDILKRGGNSSFVECGLRSLVVVSAKLNAVICWNFVLVWRSCGTKVTMMCFQQHHKLCLRYKSSVSVKSGKANFSDKVWMCAFSSSIVHYKMRWCFLTLPSS